MSDTAVADRDIDAIQSSDWPQRALGNVEGFRDEGFQVVFRQSVLDDIHLHGQAHSEIEVCGVLIGNGFNDGVGPYLLVEHSIRGLETRGHSTNVTFTAETWQHIQETMDREYPEKKMIGWYHTHPGFGIFLSGMDQFICDNFFNLPWQSAFVYDPLSGEEGNFVWRAGKTRREPMLIEDDVTPKSAGIPLISVAAATAGDNQTMPNNEKVIELLSRVRLLEKRQKFLIVAMAFLMAFVVYFSPLVNPPVKPTTMPGMVDPEQEHPAAVKQGTMPAAPSSRPIAPRVTPPVFDPSTQPML